MAHITGLTGCTTPKSKLKKLPERDAAATHAGSDGGGDASSGNGMLALDAPCQQGTDACKAGLDCVKSLNGDEGRCKQTCDKSEECTSGCCDQAEGLGDTFCVEQSECTCGRLDRPCSAGGTGCCFGLVCVVGAVDASVSGELTGCKKSCKVDAECDSECCVLFVGQNHGACGPKEYCN